VVQSLEGVLSAAVAAAEAAGGLLYAEFHRAGGPRGERGKAPVDTEMEEALRTALQSALDCDFLGEETGFTKGSVAGWRWVVDPHDGTTDFLKGYRGSAVSVGLLRGATPVLGVVHCPMSPDRGRETFAWAEGAGPMRRNGQPVATDLAGRRLESGAIVWCTESAALRPRAFARGVAPARFVAMSSIAHRLARVAAGDGVAALSAHSVHEYDIAGGAALLRAAGGVLLDAEGREIVFSGVENARVTGCIAGAPQAAARLARVRWAEVNAAPKAEPRVRLAFPRLADEARLARAQGSLLGQVIGDSLGALVEFSDARAIARAYPQGVRDLADGGVWGTIAGQPTDDSELALSLARSILRAGRYDAPAALAAYRGWLRSGPFDVGRATRAGLEGKPDAKSEANGSLMRISPIGVWAAGDPARAAAAAREDSRLTHPNAVCVEACAGFAAAIAAGIASGDRRAMLAAARAHSSGAAREAIERGAAGEPPRDFATQQGWVLIALQNAFYRLVHARSFESAIVETVSAGGDTDTNGAIAGALLGAAWGRDAVPSRWLLPVLACRPCEEVGARRPRPVEYWPDDVLEVAEALLQIGGAP
jgi:ADP-ribosyl-[dinitrogen reductase] hydrolase